MVSPNEILDAIERSLDAAPDIPDAMSYLTHEWDRSSTEAAASPPLTEIYPIGEPQRTGTSETSKIRDDAGGVIGRLIRVPFSMDVQIETSVVVGGGYNAGALGKQVRNRLYRHDDGVRDIRAEPLRGEPTAEYPDGIPLGDVTGFRVGLGQPGMDDGATTTVRQWILSVNIDFYEVVDSTDEFGPATYVQEYVWAHDGEMVSGEQSEKVSYDPHDHWP